MVIITMIIAIMGIIIIIIMTREPQALATIVCLLIHCCYHYVLLRVYVYSLLVRMFMTLMY